MIKRNCFWFRFAFFLGLVFDARWIGAVDSLVESINKANVVQTAFGTMIYVFVFALVSGFVANIWFRISGYRKSHSGMEISGLGFNIGACAHYFFAILISSDPQAIVLGVFHLCLIVSNKIIHRLERW